MKINTCFAFLSLGLSLLITIPVCNATSIKKYDPTKVGETSNAYEYTDEGFEFVNKSKEPMSIYIYYTGSSNKTLENKIMNTKVQPGEVIKNINIDTSKEVTLKIVTREAMLTYKFNLNPNQDGYRTLFLSYNKEKGLYPQTGALKGWKTMLGGYDLSDYSQTDKSNNVTQEEIETAYQGKD